MTKRDLAQLTNLSFSTVGSICNALAELGLLEELPVSIYRVGRTPKLVRLKPLSCLTICLNFERKDVMDLAVLRTNNEILYFEQFNTSDCRSIEELVCFAHEKFRALKETQAWFPQASFLGVGVSVSGVFDKETRRIVNSAIPTMENKLVTDMVEKIFRLPCYVDNEANLCAVAISQKEVGTTNLLYLHLSEGAGVGVVCEGNLLRGNLGYAAEIAHMPLGTIQRQCPSCGNYGCVEPDLCVQGLVEDFEGALEPGQTFGVRWQAISNRILHAENDFTRQYVQRKGELVGMVLSILINLFDPQEVFVGGEICSIYEKIEPVIESVLQKRCMVYGKGRTRLRCDLNGNRNIILGLNQIMFERWNPFTDTLET